MLIRAYFYIRRIGAAGLRAVAENAVLNARYLREICPKELRLAFPGDCMHEFVLSAGPLKESCGVRALDLAKRLIDHGIHPPTIYFPQTVEEALMIEPTETERRSTLDNFARVLGEIVEEARADPEVLQTAPHTTSISRVDEVRAARELDLRHVWPEQEPRDQPDDSRPSR